MTVLPQIVVVGAGLVGTAAARRLSERGLQVTCVGPMTGDPPFSSHDDSSRITRILDPDTSWALLACRAIADYSDIEQRSGMTFHHPVGVLWSSSTPEPLARLGEVGETLDVDIEAGLGGWDDMLAVDPGLTLLERGMAGYIEPRMMLGAHRELALDAGAQFARDVVSGIDRQNGRWVVGVHGGESLRADLVLVAAGAASDRLVDLEMTVTAEVVMDVTFEPDGRSFDNLPCLGRFNPQGDVDLYFTPPIATEAGWVLKLGSERSEPLVLSSAGAVHDWMSGNDHDAKAPQMLSALSELLPNLKVSHGKTKPCIYARTASGFPIVDEIDDGLFVATGGNGRMAKSSDSVAAMAVALAIDGTWDERFPRERFRAASTG